MGQEIEVIDTKGHLPDFWDRNVVFFANLLALFFGNEEETTELAEEVGEVDSYGGRLIPILDLIFHGDNGPNVLVLERRPAEALCRYFEKELGLTLPELHILSHRDYEEIGQKTERGDMLLEEFGQRPARWVDGYVTDSTLLAIAEVLGKSAITTKAGSREGNNKFLLHQFLEEQGMPTVATETAENVEVVKTALAKLKERGFTEAVLKSQIGASGIGMLKVKSIAESDSVVDSIPQHMFYEGPLMVQGWLRPGEFNVKSMRSPSVQIFVDDDTAWLFDITEQILSQDSIHEGNISPPLYLDEMEGVRNELFRQAGKAAKWLHGRGYRGTASADFLLVEWEDGREPGVFVCEVNARVTGATYPSVLARHFRPKGAWLLRNLRLSEPVEEAELLKMLDRTGLLFKEGCDSGVLPINFNFGPDNLVHKGQFLCIGSTPDECWECLKRTERNLPVEWVTDRD